MKRGKIDGMAKHERVKAIRYRSVIVDVFQEVLPPTAAVLDKRLVMKCGKTDDMAKHEGREVDKVSICRFCLPRGNVSMKVCKDGTCETMHNCSE